MGLGFVVMVGVCFSLLFFVWWLFRYCVLFCFGLHLWWLVCYDCCGIRCFYWWWLFEVWLGGCFGLVLVRFAWLVLFVGVCCFVMVVCLTCGFA